MAYENEDTVVSPASRAKSGEGKQRLDEEIVSGLTRYQLTSFITSYLFLQLNEIEDGIRELKQRIVNEYVESSSTLTIVVLVLLFAGLGFTFYKVNKLVNKAHMF